MNLIITAYGLAIGAVWAVVWVLCSTVFSSAEVKEPTRKMSIETEEGKVYEYEWESGS